MGKAVAVLLVAVLAGFLRLQFQSRISLPDHLLGHPALAVPNIMSPETGRELMALVRDFGSSPEGFPVLTGDLKFYNTTHEHIGEAQPVNAEGKCDHPFLLRSKDKTHCHLPGRVDVGRHYITYGGVEGLKHYYNNMISRVQGFMVYLFKPSDYPVIHSLFESEQFLQAAKDVCPPEKQYLDAFQFNFIIQLPGQTVALHLDAPYFWGATRFQFPQWLLIAMTFSNLFEDRFVDQVQVVGYLHEWQENRNGDFVYWNDKDLKAKYIPPKPFTGTSVDGSKTVHAAMVYRREQELPNIDKDADSKLKLVGEDQWQFISNGKVIANYTTDDLRVAVVYRARCFKDSAEAEQYTVDGIPGGPEVLPLEEVLDTFKADLVRRGLLAEAKAQTIDRLELALLILDTYITYPLPLAEHALIPVNYCMAGKLYPFLGPLLDLVCS